MIRLTALLCPYCAGRDDGGVAAALVVGAMVAVPFVVVAVVVPVLRRLTREDGR